MHRKRAMVILLTAGVGSSILVSAGMAGTYVYRDKDGKEVRELPQAERRSREAEPGRKDAKPASRRRAAGERPATVVVEKVEQEASQEKR